VKLPLYVCVPHHGRIAFGKKEEPKTKKVVLSTGKTNVHDRDQKEEEKGMYCTYL
jgi:hypothetical protein